ncbi:MAG TPA: hypothetical protein VMI35_01415, partial [Puia sp.]|nr:hypothetical protein [Puia sp.]
MKKIAVFALSLLLACTWFACTQQGSGKTATRFIITENMDSAVRPGDNFYLFVNGRWQKNAVIPPTENSAGAFLDLFNRTKENLKTILVQVSNGAQTPGSIEQKVGDLYASGMDSITIEKLG